MPDPADGPAVFLSAGESSGDLHGAALARELLARDSRLRLYGLGGERMADAGVELLADLDDLAVMGVAEVARRLPYFISLRRRVTRFLLDRGVRLFIPIDYPGFNLPAADFAHRHGLRVLYYIAPQVWAWRERRARRLARVSDRVCVVLPFEEELLAGYGADVRFVGHPLLDTPTADAAGGGGGAALGLFPGSRAHEVERMLPPFAAAAERLRQTDRDLRVLVARPPHLPLDLYEETGLETAAPERVISRAAAALCKSGTITLQLALAGVPMTVGHRMSPLTYRIARRLVRVPHVALVNLVAGERLVTELIQDELTPEAAADSLIPLLVPESPERERIRAGLKRVRERLGSPGCSGRVADHALELLAS